MSVCDSFSYSKLDCFLGCPKQFEYVYVLKTPVKEQVKPDSLLGVGLHRALEKFFPQRYEWENLEHEWKNACVLSVPEERWTAIFSNPDYKWNTKLEKQGFFYNGRSILRNFFNNNHKVFTKDTYQLIQTERYFKVKFCDWFLTGFIDKIEKHNDKVFVIDYKTGNWTPSQQEVDENLQLTIYSIAYRKMFEQDEHGLFLHFIKNNRYLKTTRDKTHYKTLYSTLERVTKQIENKQFEATPNVFSCGYCKYNQICENSLTKSQFEEW